ncbi:MAG: GNAT family N-acetyltransferase [Xanthobacteraceae bacterium]|nr:GNAT family N-acetyltransferase [Xanthobacteraceae bacterium]
MAVIVSMSPGTHSNIEIRPGRAEDIGVLLSLKHRMASELGSEHAMRATAEDWMRDAFGHPPRFFAIVAESEGNVVGMITCSDRYYTAWAGCSLYIQDFYIEPDYRHRGIGSSLLSAVAELAQQRSSVFVELMVSANNPSRRLYRRLGFQRVKHAMMYTATPSEITRLALGDRPAIRP